MKITGIKIALFEVSDLNRLFDLVLLDGMQRDCWIHRHTSSGPGHAQIMRVTTDAGVEGVCTVTQRTLGDIGETLLAQLRHLAIGENPLYREKLYQKLHTGTRWVYQEPGWAAAFDNCLWDIAGKAANLPVHALIGRVRERIPAYLNIGGPTKEEAAAAAARAVAEGFPAVKDHFYHPVDENIQWFEAVREAVGSGIDIMHDPVAIYTFEEAVRIGRALEGLNYRWLEEPLPDRQQNKLIELCATLDIPVLAPEMMMNDVDLCAQWLLSGATDMIRANAAHGTTAVLKLAHLAEMHGTSVELNGTGGLYGLVHAHLLCCIANTSYYEYFGGAQERSGLEFGMSNPVLPIEGHIAPPDGPGWGAEWDWDFFDKKQVGEL